MIRACISKLGAGDILQPKQCEMYAMCMYFPRGCGFSPRKKNIFFRFQIFEVRIFGYPDVEIDDWRSRCIDGRKSEFRKFENRKNIFFRGVENPLPLENNIGIVYISQSFGCGSPRAPSLEIEARINR